MSIYTKSHAIGNATYKAVITSIMAAVVAGAITGLGVYLLENILSVTWEQIWWTHAILFMLLSEVMAIEVIDEGSRRGSIAFFFGPVIIATISGMLFSNLSLIYIGTIVGLFLQSLREDWNYIGCPMDIGPPPKAPYDYTVR